MEKQILLTDKQKKLLALLADGEFHSGTVLAEKMAISRTAICKKISQLTELLELNLLAVSGKGYRLDKPLELLDATRITAELTDYSRQLIKSLVIYDQIDSTNRYLAEQLPLAAGEVCLAEQQTAGRGRRGREWVSPFGHNIYLSLAWQFPQGGLAALSGLSLAVGVAVIRALTAQNILEVGLKWPNDIYAEGKKLGGILIEVSGEADGSCHAIIGIGLNLFLPNVKAQHINQPWTDISHLIGYTPARNQLIASLLNQLLPVVAEFEQQGLNHYLAEWRHYDCVSGQTATLFVGQQAITGTIHGINEQGLLLMQRADGSIQAFASGEISFNRTSHAAIN